MRKTITFTQAIRILAQDRHEPCLCQLREGPDLDLHITINRGAAVSDPEPDQWELVFEDYILQRIILFLPRGGNSDREVPGRV